MNRGFAERGASTGSVRHEARSLKPEAEGVDGHCECCAMRRYARRRFAAEMGTSRCSATYYCAATVVDGDGPVIFRRSDAISKILASTLPGGAMPSATAMKARRPAPQEIAPAE